MADEVYERIADTVARTLHVERGRITAESRVVEDLGADSMQSVELVAAFEEEFDIEMDETKALNVKTVSNAVEFVAAHLE